MRLITVTPAGRKRYMELLVTYLLRSRDVISEHHWWLNTHDRDDIAYIHSTAAQYPDFFKVVSLPLPPRSKEKAFDSFQIHRFFEHACWPDAVYVRLDDDIVW